jgi:methionine-rich copper-binding protein CopC
VRRTFLTASALVLASMATEVQAHARLEKAAPPAGGAVAAAPQEIRLTFSEAVEPRLSGIVLSDAAGKKIATGQPTADPKDRAELVVPLPQPLTPGVYKVEWHAISADTHKTRGAFSFTIKP